MDLFTGGSTVAASHGPQSWRPEDVFVDSRQFGNPERSRFVKLPNATPDGGAFSFSERHRRTVLVGRETLRVLTIGGSQEPSSELVSEPVTKPLAFAVGPGGAKVEAGPNHWSSKFRTIHQMTDVTWGPEGYNTKALTSCSNGEVMLWDFGQGALKLESSLAGSARSVNVVAAAAHSGYNIATGSNDGSVKLWDLRHPGRAAFTLSSHGSAVRSLTFGQTSSLPVHVVLGLESGMIFRYDLRIKIDYLDRIIAHTACVHDLAWLPPPEGDPSSGYLASGSLDHTVKIWQIEPSRISLKPLHTLHTPYPIGKIGWRPSFDTEIVVLPYHSNASIKTNPSAQTPPTEPVGRFAPQVWDVRKGWIAKWNVLSNDGPGTDMLVTNPQSIHVLHRSGSFVQYDLHKVTRPYDVVPRQALTWNAQSSLFFVVDQPRPFDPPYDDVHPALLPQLADYGLADKKPGDRLSTLTSQVLDMQVLPLEPNFEVYKKLARGYNHHDGDRVKMCKVNEEVAAKADQLQVAQTWALLGSLLTELAPKKPEPPSSSPVAQQVPPITPSIANFGPLSAKEPSSATKSMSSPPLTGQPRPEDVSGFSLDALNATTRKRQGSGGAAMLPPHTQQAIAYNQKRRGSSPSLLSQTKPGGVNRTRSPSSSPANAPLKLPSSIMGPSSMIRPPLLRKMSRSSGGNSHSHSPGPTSALEKSVIVADGALETGSSDEDEANADIDDSVLQSEASESSWSKEKKKVSKMGVQHPTLHSSSSSTSPSPALGGKKALPPMHLIGTRAALLSHSNSRLASPQVQLLDIQDVNEEDLGDEDEATDEEDQVSASSASIHKRDPSSEDDRNGSLDNSTDSLQATHSPPSPTLAKFHQPSDDSSRATTIGRGGLKVLTKHDSSSSLTTAYQMPDGGFVGSFGSNMMTPTMARMNAPLPSSNFRPTNPFVGSMPVGGLFGGMERRDEWNGGDGSGRKGDSAAPRSLSDLFTSPISGTQPPSTASVTTPSTGIPPFAHRGSTTRNESIGSRGNKGHASLMSMSAIPSAVEPVPNKITDTADDGGEDVSKSIWVEEHAKVIEDLEKTQREEMLLVLREVLEAYAEEGNVQMCAAMAMAAHEELGIEKERLERFVLAYLDQLMRMRLHLNAAYVRRNSPITTVKDTTAFDAMHKVTCSSCAKEIVANGPPDTVGRYAYCEKCKRMATHCSICHLPVRRMLIFCHGCGHGGHQKCYQEFYRRYPLFDVSNPTSKFPHSRAEELLDDETQDGEGEEGTMYSDEGRRLGPSEKSDSTARGRRRDIRRQGSEVDMPESIPEKEPVHFPTQSNPPSTTKGPLFGHRDPHTHPPYVDKRSSSIADTSTIVDADQGLPDEEYILVREKEAMERELERKEMKLLGRFCATGCGHICWMTRQ